MIDDFLHTTLVFRNRLFRCSQFYTPLAGSKQSSANGIIHPGKKKHSVSKSVLFLTLSGLVMFGCTPVALGETNEIIASKSSSQQHDLQVRHLYTAKLLLRRLSTVELTPSQLKAFDELSADLTKKIEQMRTSVGITKDVIKRRDEVYSKLKHTNLKGDVFWETLQEEAGITVAQRDVFRETLDHFAKFRADVYDLLTDDQKARVPKGKLPPSK